MTPTRTAFSPFVCLALFAAMALLIQAGPAQAQDCANATTQLDINMCANADYKKADAKLNANYKQVMARLSAPAQTRLRDAQRAWIGFRDKHCAFITGGSDGGSAAAMITMNCLAGETEQRAEALKKLVTCQEGDLACPR